MGKTSIEWLKGRDGSEGFSWNALRARRKVGGRPGITANHCEHVNEACRFCYAESLNARLGGLPFKPGHRNDYEFFVDEKKLTAPLRMRKPTIIFVESMSDAFGDWWPDSFVDKLYAVMALSPQHTYVNLSKRPERRRLYLDAPGLRSRIDWLTDLMLPEEESWCGDWPLPNVIEGTSVSCQSEADEFVPELLRTNASILAVSAEPLLGPIDFTRIHNPHGIAPSDTLDAFAPWGTRGQLDWIIVGGEGGTRARPMHLDWARSIRDQCEAAGVAFHFKQHGAWIETDGLHCQAIDQSSPGERFWLDPDGSLHSRSGDRSRSAYGPSSIVMRVGKKAAGRVLDGREWNGFPEIAR